MEAIEMKPKKGLNKAFLKVKPSRIEIEGFKTNLIQLLDRANDTESEEFHKNLVIDFLKKTYYEPNHFVNTKGRNDLVIHNGSHASSTVGVIIEAKKPTNKAEMMATKNLNVKALQELVLYYLRERITHNNLEVKYLIATNINEWFVFDATLFDRLFAQNKTFVQQFNDFENGRLADTKTDFFYKQVAKPFIANIKTAIEFTYFNIQDYQKPLRSSNPANDGLVIDLFKLLSPQHLLKQPFANDSNSLDRGFYNELLHIIGLTETKEGSKKLIERNKENERHSGSIIEDTIIQLDSLDKISRLDKPSQFGNTQQERLFNVAIELNITWINRVLFLKLLEAQLLSYHKGDAAYAFLSFDKIKNYDDLNSLFFQVLARKEDDRNQDVKMAFEKVPYLNSSLFEPTEMEQVTLFVSNLKDDKTIPIIASTVLKNEQGKKRTGNLNTLQYLFEFLNAYNFGSDGTPAIQEDNKSLINASVLGLIFEKINGYKDGSFFTPGFVTMYMCRETIRRAVVQKFNDAKNWHCSTIDDVYDKIDDRKQANDIINSIKICDPSVGSGHFLVSALNEMIAVKNDLKILQDRTGKRLKEYHVEVLNDELIVTDEDGELFEYSPTTKESQRIQEALFHEKQTIIENCLFGVDINPNSVKICRLRLWIELLKNAYYQNGDLRITNDELKTTPISHSLQPVADEPNLVLNIRKSSFNVRNSLQTLPNIDINIKCGNSLVSRFAIDADLSQALKKSKGAASRWTIDSYKMAVDTYRNAQSREQKREMERLIADIKAEFRTEISLNDPKAKKLRKLSGDLFMMTNQTQLFEMDKKQKEDWTKTVLMLTEEVQQLEADIEEIKANKIFENAFEWRFEFPEVLNEDGDFVGFDVLIGNPPYVDYRELGSAQTDILKQYKTSENSPRPNLYQYFIEKGYTILAQNGYFCYINPNQFLSIDAGYGIRKLIVENTIIQFIDDVSNIKVFDEAATYTVIWCFKKEKNGNYPVRISKCIKPEDIGITSLTVRKNDIIANGKYLIIANVNQVLIGKIEQNKIKLGQLSNMIWGTSQTGYGQKKIKIDAFEKLSDLDKATYRPIIQTRDIKNYIIDWKGEYIPIDLFSTNAVQKFDEPQKIVIARMTLRLQAAIDFECRYVGKSTVVFDVDKRLNKKYLLAILNSKVVNFWYSNYFENTHLSGGYIRFDIPYLKKIPIPIATIEQQVPIIRLVEEMTGTKSVSVAQLTDLESQIDQLVYKLYELTEEEIKIVEAK